MSMSIQHLCGKAVLSANGNGHAGSLLGLSASGTWAAALSNGWRFQVSAWWHSIGIDKAEPPAWLGISPVHNAPILARRAEVILSCLPDDSASTCGLRRDRWRHRQYSTGCPHHRNEHGSSGNILLAVSGGEGTGHRRARRSHLRQHAGSGTERAHAAGRRRSRGLRCRGTAKRIGHGDEA